MIKNIIFDLGGVIVEWNPKLILQTFPGNPDLIRYIHANGFFSNYWSAYDKGILTREQVIEKIAPLTGCSVEDCNEFIEFVKVSLVNIPETEKLIQELSQRDYKLFCLSNMSEDFYEYLKPRKVFSYFEGKIISAIEKMVKPDREIYELLLNRYHLKAEESLFIDDLPANIQAAQKMGIHTVHFTDKEKAYQEIKDRLKTSKRRIVESV